MASVPDALISAVLGLTGGLIGSVINERLKSEVAVLEAELTRLDALHDKISDLLSSPPDFDRNAGLREASSSRRRLGLNLRRLFPDTPRFQIISAQLTRLDRVIGVAEDGHLLDVQLESELEEIVRGMRVAVMSGSVKTQAYRLLRGR